MPQDTYDEVCADALFWYPTSVVRVVRTWTEKASREGSIDIAAFPGRDGHLPLDGKTSR